MRCIQQSEFRIQHSALSIQRSEFSILPQVGIGDDYETVGHGRPEQGEIRGQRGAKGGNRNTEAQEVGGSTVPSGAPHRGPWGKLQLFPHGLLHFALGPLTQADRRSGGNER